jgi:hypothetical protein
MRATLACSRAVQASAKVDHFGDAGRVRGDILFIAARPASLRMDVVSPFGAALATMTTDGSRFTMADLKDRRFLEGPARACNLARLTTLSVPGHVLVDLLRGEAPVLKHDPAAGSIRWSASGYWVLSVPGEYESQEELHLAPYPADWNLPWQTQRLRLLDVRVEQQGYLLYHADLGDHAATHTAPPRPDPDGLEPPILPSGPDCNADAPRKIRIELESPHTDVRLSYQQIVWNPPIPAGTFQQTAPPGMAIETVECE